MQGLNAVAKLGALGGKPKYSNSDNPVSSFLKKVSGGVIAKGLKKDAQNFENLTQSQKEKHKLVGDYAKKLQGTKDRYRPGQGKNKGRTV